MSGALNNRSTFAGRVGVGGVLPPPSCACVRTGLIMPAVTTDAAPMNSRRRIFMEPPPSKHHLQPELDNARIAGARISAGDPSERRRVVDEVVRDVEVDH